MIRELIEVLLAIYIITFSYMGGFVVEGDFLALIAFSIAVLCFGFIGIMEAIKEVGERLGGEKYGNETSF